MIVSKAYIARCRLVNCHTSSIDELSPLLIGRAFGGGSIVEFTGSPAHLPREQEEGVADNVRKMVLAGLPIEGLTAPPFEEVSE